jgi:hypothetical protein
MPWDRDERSCERKVTVGPAAATRVARARARRREVSPKASNLAPGAVHIVVDSHLSPRCGLT